ncbi:MAG: hypothetical protein ACRC8C_00150 [Mycoplasmoidaceae bacterium]
MKKFNSQNIEFKTKPIITSLTSLFFIFIPYGLIWIFFGEGRVVLFENNNINIGINAIWFDQISLTYSYQFYLVYFMFLLLPILILIIGKFIFKIMQLDIIPFLYMSCAFWIGVLLTGIMPSITNDNSLIDIIITGKIIFIIIFSLIFFFIFNFIINIIILRSRNFSSFFKDFKKENDINDEIIKSQKSILDKVKKEKETTWEV